MSVLSFLFRGSKETDSALPDIYPLSLTCDAFTESDIVSTYLKILTDTVERTHGIPDALNPLLWDNCVQNEASDGLISLLAYAMAEKANLFLVYKKEVKVVREADRTEQEQIEKDYKEKGESKLGVFVSFKGYRRTELLEIYSEFEYCVIASLNKSLNLSKAIQLKINDLRASVSLGDAEVAKAQARGIASALSNGKDILIDAKDSVETADPDTEPAEKAINFLDAKKAWILGLPLSYISGEQTPGIGSTGEADTKAVERGLKQYFVSILQPVFKALFGWKTEFKSQDFRSLGTALEALKTFDLVSEDILSLESKRELVARIFELDIKKEKKALKSGETRDAAEEDTTSDVEPEEDEID